jgi:hypothetical protein
VTDEGTLEELDVADLVQHVGARRLTGRLLLERADDRIVVTVEQGRLVFASSSDPDHRLGPMLLRSGAITLRQMEDAVKNQKPGKRFGTILVENGVLDPKQLVRGVVDQTREIILWAFRWTTGSYRLSEGKGPGEDITLNISTPQLVLDGISQIESWTRIERGCGGIEARYAPAVHEEDVDVLLRQLTLDVDQTMLLRSVPDVRPLEALCAESALNHFEVCRNVWAFRVIGLLRRVPIDRPQPLDDDGLEFVLPGESG